MNWNWYFERRKSHFFHFVYADLTLYDGFTVQLHHSSKFPSQVTSINIASLAGSGAGDNSSTSYRIPEGVAATICRTVDTCDYCIDTVEAV